MRDIRVMFVGDSHVAGVGDPDGPGWLAADRPGAAAALLAAPRPGDCEPDWSVVERELLDSKAATDL